MSAINKELVMQMRTGNTASRANATNQLALTDSFAGLYVLATQV